MDAGRVARGRRVAGARGVPARTGIAPNGSPFDWAIRSAPSSEALRSGLGELRNPPRALEPFPTVPRQVGALASGG